MTIVQELKLAMALALLGFGAAADGQSNAAVPTRADTEWQRVLGEARSAARTNIPLALSLCSKASALAPNESAPWLLRAALYDNRREFAAALTNASACVRLNPRAPQGWQMRGTIHFKLSHFRESVADFDRFLELVPEQRPYHWQRGISLYYAGDFAAGRKQFELHESVNPNDVENAVWHFLCVARSEGVTRARQILLKPGPDSRVPMKEVLELFAGNRTPDDVMAAAERSGDKGAVFYGRLYVGLYFGAIGEKAKEQNNIDQAAAIAPDDYMGEVARVHARFLRRREPH